MNLDQYKYLTFDCYGTLIDWKGGVLDAIRPLLSDYNIDLEEEEIFGLFAAADRQITGGMYRKYAEILVETMDFIGEKLSINFFPEDKQVLVNTLPEWPPFSDTITALKKMEKTHKLVILSNIDNDLIDKTINNLGMHFHRVITAEQVKSYKPSPVHFHEALEQLDTTTEQVLHIAQSVYHDIVPAKSLGWHTVWVNRYGEPERTNPDEFPELEVPDLISLIKISRLER